MKILIISPKYYPDTFPINLIAERLVKEGHDVHVLTSVPFKDGKYVEEYCKSNSYENGVTVYRVKTYIRNDTTYSLIRYYQTLLREFKKWVRKTHNPYDLVYSYSVSPVISLGAGNLYKKKHHVKHVAHVLDLWPESVVDAGYARKHSLFYRVLLHWSRKDYRTVDELLIGTESFKSYLKDVIKIKNDNVKYLPQPGLVYEGNIENNPFDTKKTNLLYCGNISKLQLVDYIIPAMEKLNNPNVVFNIIGTGSYLNELKQELKDKNLANVIYHGYYNYKDSSKFLNHADCLFVPLKNRGFVGKTLPNKLISSLYYGKPIIGMINGVGREILLKNDNIIVEESVDGLVKGINEYLSLNKKQVEEISKKNKKLYDDSFSIDKFIKKLLSSFSRK